MALTAYDPASLADLMAQAPDLDAVKAALIREDATRHVMAETGEDRQTVTDMMAAVDSMDQEAVLDLMDGEPTTLRAGLQTYVAELSKRDPDGDELTPVARVLAELGALLAYPWPES